VGLSVVAFVGLTAGLLWAGLAIPNRIKAIGIGGYLCYGVCILQIASVVAAINFAHLKGWPAAFVPLIASACLTLALLVDVMCALTLIEGSTI
jgi:hypothetical protein